MTAAPDFPPKAGPARALEDLLDFAHAQGDWTNQASVIDSLAAVPS
jgi:hypothetical protein